jgi:CRP/FNR family cyclic AMP-dependent transcriptional regulator
MSMFFHATETTWISVIGYIASGFVAMSFYMRTMVPLRIVAICSNFFFIAYAFLETPILYPVLILHLFLLPLNIIRLWQIKQLIDGIHAFEHHQYSLSWLIPYMTVEHHPQGTVLFQKGDDADKMFLIEKGRIELPSIKQTIGPGDLLGEIGVLSPFKKRTSDAVCLDPVMLLSLNDKEAMRLYYQDPKFGLFLIQLVIKRSLENYEKIVKV